MLPKVEGKPFGRPRKWLTAHSGPNHISGLFQLKQTTVLSPLPPQPLQGPPSMSPPHPTPPAEH